MDRKTVAKAVFMITVSVILNVLMAIPWEKVADTLLKRMTTGSDRSRV